MLLLLYKKEQGHNMESTTLISIITPVYNVEAYIDKCIKSILAQTYPNFELILVDDGSKDSSGKICDYFAAKDPRIHVFHIANSGVSGARNYALEHINGEYICFVDSDDYISPIYLSTLYSLIINYSADISICNYTDVDFSGRTLNNSVKEYSEKTECYKPQEIAKKVYEKNFVPFVVVWNKLYSKKIWKQLRFPEKTNCEDDIIVQKLYHIAEKIVFKDIPLYYYVQNNSGIIHSPDKISANKLDDMYGLFLHSFFLHENGEIDTAQDAFHCYFTHGIQILADLKSGQFRSNSGEIITFKGFLRKLKFHYSSAKKELKLQIKRRIYYTLFLAFPSLVIALRTLNHKLKKAKNCQNN